MLSIGVRYPQRNETVSDPVDATFVLTPASPHRLMTLPSGHKSRGNNLFSEKCKLARFYHI